MKKPRKIKIRKYLKYAKNGFTLVKDSTSASDLEYTFDGQVKDVMENLKELLDAYPEVYLERAYTYDYYKDRSDHIYAYIETEETDEEQTERLDKINKQQSERDENDYKNWLVLKEKFGDK
jgi:flavodoxin